MKTSDTIKQIMAEECTKEYNLLDPSFYFEHLAVVEKYSLALASVCDADIELVSIASYIHDISAVRDFPSMAEHHIKGATIARQILAGLLPESDIEKICDAIAHHNFPVKEGNPEAIVLSNADSMSKFDSPFFWIAYAHKRKCGSFKEAVIWYKTLLDKTWELMIPEAKDIIDTQRDAVNVLLESGHFLRNESL